MLITINFFSAVLVSLLLHNMQAARAKSSLTVIIMQISQLRTTILNMSVLRLN